MDGGTVAFFLNSAGLHSATLQHQQGFSHTWHIFYIGWGAFIFFWHRHQNLSRNTMVEILTSAPKTTTRHSMWKPVEAAPKLWHNVSPEQFAGTPQCKKSSQRHAAAMFFVTDKQVPHCPDHPRRFSKLRISASLFKWACWSDMIWLHKGHTALFLY